MALATLLLAPDQDSYTIDDGDEIIATKVDGGPPKMRRNFLGSYYDVTVQWTLNPDQYQYLRAFYNYVNKGADEFYLDLLLETGELRTHVCRFKAGTFKTQSVKGYSFRVKCTLEVAPNDEGLDYADIVSTYAEPPYVAPDPPTDWGIE